MLITQKVSVGDVVVDATMGNGNDTLCLSRAVGQKGHVFAFDIQQKAIDNTKALLESNDAFDNVTLIKDGHENLDKHLKSPVKLVLFNLGFLPKSDKQITTKSATTITAVEKAFSFLDRFGLLLTVAYPGHKEGMKEKEDILRFSSNLPQNKFNVFYMDLINQKNNPPVLIGIEKQ